MGDGWRDERWEEGRERANALCAQTLQVRKAISQLLARGQGCTTRWALQLFETAATSRLLYALPLVALPPPCLRKLELQHRPTIRVCLGVPRNSQVAATLAEAGTWPLSLLLLQQGLLHIDHLHHAADGQALLTYLRSRPASHMGRLCGLCKEVIGDMPAHVVQPRSPHRPPISISTELPGVSKNRSATCALQQTAASLLQERLGDRLHIFVDGSVIPETGSSTAACVAPALQKSKLCRLPGHTSSTAAELPGLHLAVDLLAEELPTTPAAIFCDSKAALLCLQSPDKASLGVALLSSRLVVLQDAGCSLFLHWLPAHVGIPGNEEADTLAKSAHHSSVPLSPAVTAADFTRHKLCWHIIACHTDKRASLGRPPRPLPQHGLPRRDTSLLLRLWVDCYWTAAHRHRLGKATSPACASCGDPETLEHLLLACPAHLQHRGRLLQEFSRLGLPCSRQEDILLPCRNQLPAFLSVVEYLDSSGLSARL
ncbi:uncharacterized protein [Dermacentor albipictus]|uniref:uncharacterized protein n=1 Tax=Dermacentor albipictus TaxID=60249 RepID=UPI0038FCEB10